MNQTLCNNCRQQISEQALAGLYILTWKGGYGSTVPDHFCSWECIQEYAEKRIATGTQNEKVPDRS